MSVEEQLREYRATLDAETERGAAAHASRVAAPVRIRPVRSLAIAAVAVAAAIAIAFAAVGVTHRSSTPPAGNETSTTPTSASSPITAGRARVPDVDGMTSADAVRLMGQVGFVVKVVDATCTDAPRGVVTAQDPPAGSVEHAGSTTALTVCSAPAAPGTVTLPVTACDTVEGVVGITSRPPTSIVVPRPSASGDPLSGFADKEGRLVTTAPLSWTCAAVDAADGGATLELPAPTGSGTSAFDPGSPSDHDGLFAISIPACQGCVHGEVCGIVPNADAEVPGYDGLCTARPAGETIIPLGDNVYRIEDPAGAVTPDPAISILIFHPRTSASDASVARETCAFQNQLDVCTSLLNQFLALNR